MAIHYADRELVTLGDHVLYRSWLFFWRGSRSGRISYVPGISTLHPEMEHDGLTWVGVSGDDGTFMGVIVDPQTKAVKDTVRFVRRSDGTPFLTPDQIRPEDW